MKERIFSGIQPSGNLHLGNYLGAVKNWVKLQEKYDSIFCIVDLHAITVPQNPQDLSQKTLEVAKLYVAAGIDPEKSTIFVQSGVKEHAELMWLLNTITKTGDLFKMTQFKDKTKIQSSVNIYLDAYKKNIEEIEKGIVKNYMNKGSLPIEVLTDYRIGVENVLKEGLQSKFKDENKMVNVHAGLFNYPILMAADILLYNTNLVPVGEDQLQHVELTQKLGRKFNSEFGETFVIPEGYTQKEGMRIMGLDNPANKMSKSAPSEYNRINILDNPETITKKIMKAVTDSEQGIEYSDNKPALKNLLNIFASVTNRKPEEIAEEYKNQGYKEFKEGLAEAVVDYLRPIQEKYHQISDDEIKSILNNGADQARKIAEIKIYEVKEKMGLVS